MLRSELISTHLLEPNESDPMPGSCFSIRFGSFKVMMSFNIVVSHTHQHQVSGFGRVDMRCRIITRPDLLAERGDIDATGRR